MSASRLPGVWGIDSGETLEVEVDVTNQGDFTGESEVVLELTD